VSRVLLVGRGPLPAPDQTTGGFAQLRTRHFLGALRSAGHSVRLVLLGPGAHGPAPDGRWEGAFAVQDEGPGWLERCAALGQGAEVVVSAGPYTPGRAAVAAAGEAPLWVDVPGDPLAELEAVSRVGPDPVSPERIAAAHAAFAPVLARADALSSVSAPQRLTLLGQLGAAGRLHPGPPVHSIPIAFDLPHPRRAPRARRAADPLVVALSGSANPWLDLPTLLAAFRAVQAARPDTRFIVTGGPVPGLPAPDWPAVEAWAAAHPATVRLAGWVPHGDLPDTLAEAHVAVFADRVPGLEPELGDRTRALLAAWLGLDIVATDRSERMQDLGAAGLAAAVPPGAPDALADALLELAARDRDPDRTRALVAHLDGTSAPLPLARPLLDWVAAPRRVPSAPSPLATMAAERDRLRSDLQAVHGSPTWRTLSRLHRLLRRRG
jgi:glycosyltransferase involved in cell wall biosynthesis